MATRTQIAPSPEAPDALCDEYPCSDGEPMAENDFQYIAITDTVASLRQMYKGRDDVYVSGDMFVYYREGSPGSRVAPDVFAVFGARGSHSRHSWIVWAEGGAPPTFVLEVASVSTWRRDREEKRDLYAAIGVSEYWRFDPERARFFSPELVGEYLADGEYRALDVYTDADGVLRGHSPVLGLDLCVRDGMLRLYDPAAGEWLLNHGEQAIALVEKDVVIREQADSLAEKDAALIEQAAELERLRAQLRDSERNR